MAFVVIPLPKEERELAEVGKEIVGFVCKNVRPIEVEGFLYAWLSGLQIVKETDKDGNICGIAIMISGKRWLYSDKAITILLWKVVNEEGFFSFLRSIAAVTGINRIIYEQKLLEETPEEQIFAVREIIL